MPEEKHLCGHTFTGPTGIQWKCIDPPHTFKAGHYFAAVRPEGEEDEKL